MNSDIIELSNLDFNENINNHSLKSANFGGGIELLMNEKVKEGTKLSSDIDIEDLNNLENELNSLSDIQIKNNYTAKSDLFNTPPGFTNDKFSNNMEEREEKHFVRFDDVPNIAKFTAETVEDNKTWDDYGKFNNIPINPDINPIQQQPSMTKEELLREKFKFLRKLEALEKKGVELSKKYSMDSNLAEMQGEYETIMEEKSKQNSIKFQGNMMMAIINGIEFLNNRVDPFDIKLDGWGEQINENISDYDEIFGELYEKYKSKASLAPELKLLFQLGGSAMMVHMTNTMFKSAMPGVDDILRQNPDLMRQFQSAAVNSLGQSNPGFGGFMNGIMNPGPSTPTPSMNTQNKHPTPNYGSRSDLNAGKSHAVYVDDGINFRETNANNNVEFSKRRPEMKGPTDLSDILSGLKTKTINIKEQSSDNTNNNSTISISDLKDIQSEGNIPKRSKRRKSDKNTVSLDI